jgi:hypothetical protein
VEDLSLGRHDAGGHGGAELIDGAQGDLFT